MLICDIHDPNTNYVFTSTAPPSCVFEPKSWTTLKYSANVKILDSTWRMSETLDRISFDTIS